MNVITTRLLEPNNRTVGFEERIEKINKTRRFVLEIDVKWDYGL